MVPDLKRHHHADGKRTIIAARAGQPQSQYLDSGGLFLLGMLHGLAVFHHLWRGSANARPTTMGLLRMRRHTIDCRHRAHHLTVG